jgi:hypothetical protein
MYNKQQDMYTFLIQDVHGQWFKSKLGFITKQEAEEEAAEIAEYAFVDTIKVVEEDDYDYTNFYRKNKLS